MDIRSEKRTRRAILGTSVIGMSALALTSVLAACTSSAPPMASTPATANSTSARAAAANPSGQSVEIRISVWPDVADLDINKAQIAGFEKKTPNIKVTPEQWTNYYQKLQVDIAGNTVPDIVLFQGFTWQPYALGGQIRDLSDSIAGDSAQLPSDLFPNIDAYSRQLSMQGKHYGMPIDSSSMVMMYLKDHFDLAEVPYPKDNWTEQDWLDTLNKLQAGLKKAGKTNVYAYQPNYGDYYLRNFAWWRQDGGMEVDQLENPKKALFNSPEVAAVWQQQFHDLPQKGVAFPKAVLLSGGGNNAPYSYGIQNGLASLKVEGPWFLPQMWGPKAVTKGGLKFDVVSLPKGAKNRCIMLQVRSLTSWKTSKNPDAVWEFLKYAVSPAGQQPIAEFGRMTNTPSSLTKQWLPIVKKLYNFENAAAFTDLKGGSMVETGGVSETQFFVQGGLNAALDAVCNGTQSAEQALTAANAKIQALFDTWWKQNPQG